jgi:hypothetical protein
MTTETTADQAIEGLRLYLQQFSLGFPGDDLAAVTGVLQRVIYYLDRFRQLEAQSRGQYGWSTCGHGLSTPYGDSIYGLSTPSSIGVTGTPVVGVSSTGS